MVGSPVAFLMGLLGLFTDRPKWWALAAMLVSGPFVALLLWQVIAFHCY